MQTSSSNPGVDDYISHLPAWQQAVCSHVRRLIHEADTDIEETIKRNVQPYFVCQGNVAALLATKDHINVFIYDPIASDPEGLINQGQGNTTARTIQLYRDDTLNEKAFVALIQSVVANNKAGGWRNLSKR